MQEMAAGGASADLRFLKDYVLCHGTAPRHAATYSRGTFPEDEDFSMGAWKEGFRIKILDINEDDMTFDMSGLDVSIANALRRLLLSEVPTVAIEKVFITNNNGVLRDELLAHRLGLIPIKVDPSSFAFPSVATKGATYGSELNPDEVLKFQLKVKCMREAGAGRDQEPINSKVFSKQLEWVPIGDQEERFVNDRPEPVHRDILITRLRPGQEIDLTMHCHKGNNCGERGHAKWSPVATAWYRLLPRIDIVEEVEGEDAEALVQKCPMGCFDMEDLGNDGRRAVVSDKYRDCTLCRECVREPRFSQKVRLARKKDHFIYKIESTGIIRPADLFKQAVQTLHAKASMLLQEVEDLEGQALVDAQADDMEES
mmetsp:Transcript_15743/g.39606  ORF Transcript_15743/g.39606 Transcript_15743/m.39606 type:complete len:370 (+) Transcript_15743:36-1145(+)